MGIHGTLFEGPLPPQTRTEPPWPGRVPGAAPGPRRRFALRRLFGR